MCGFIWWVRANGVCVLNEIRVVFHRNTSIETMGKEACCVRILPLYLLKALSKLEGQQQRKWMGDSMVEILRERIQSYLFLTAKKTLILKY